MEDIKSDFERASELKSEETRMGIKDRLKEMWGQLGPIKVMCPSCSSVQKVQTDKSTSCRKCGHAFKIYPRNSKSRVVWCPPNKLWLLRNIRSLGSKGKFDEVL